GDINRRAEHANGPARAVEDDLALSRNPAHRAVGPDDACFNRVRLAVFERGIDRRADALAVFGVDELSKVGDAAAELARLQAVKAIDWIRPRHAVVDDVPVPRTDLSGFERQAQSLFVLAQRLFDLLAPRDVENRCDKAHHLAVAIELRLV